MFLGILLGIIGTILGALALSRFVGFSAQKPQDYATGRSFDLETHLNGDIDCEGVIYGPLGRVSSRFVGRFKAKWQNGSGHMTENFEYDSGSTQQREWTLALAQDGTIKAPAPDVIGTGTGRQVGSAVVLNYKIKLTDDAGGHVLDVTDWMYLAPNGAIVNRSQFRKFGIKVAELVATMRPAGAANA